MRPERKEIEIMAPAGSFESLMAAVQGGANSVYFGVEQLNMRAKSANNFELKDLPEIVRICKEHNMKSYLAVNTIMYDHDLNIMRMLVDKAKEAGVTAVIASDQAILNYAFSVGVEIHLSTQLNISNIESLAFYAHFADVVVLARELTLKQVKAIADQIQERNLRGPKGDLIRVEMFSHGALCMAVSGKCYLSLHEMNSSANRGACQQTCRKSYIVTNKETGYELEIDNEYIMSPKDLMTVNFVDEMIDSGVTVFKIEGRARSAEYVKTVTECYREAVDAVYDESYTSEKVEAWIERLSTVYNRGFWDGYYLGRKLGEWSKDYGSKATKIKRYIGKGSNYFDKIGVAEFLLESGELKVGDEILITGPTTGVIQTFVEEIRLDLTAVETAKRGDVISVPISEKVRRSDKLYILESINS
jgi:putative protease